MVIQGVEFEIPALSLIPPALTAHKIIPGVQRMMWDMLGTARGAASFELEQVTWPPKRRL